MTVSSVISGHPSERTQRAVNSALWAAVGDALGWTTELGREATVEARTGSARVEKPVDWVRRIGGKAGVQVPLPAGTYSDDTQLRLAVCRAIRGDGTFDAEAFARVELTTWQGYALGAGLGSKAAAANLAKRGVNWFSNFFETRDQKYTNAGGNGAAMRVQPHAWLKPEGEDLTLAVLRDALITHGHPHGFAGAVLHAVAVSEAMRGELIGPTNFERAFEAIRSIPAVVSLDRQLDAFWRPAWEEMAGRSLEHAVDATIIELRADIALIRNDLQDDNPDAYKDVLQKLELKSARYRGSGLKTALAASALAWKYRNQTPEAALVAGSNELGSDTDTIATMAGAILGAVVNSDPHWPIQDRAYIVEEARRLGALASGVAQDSFAYPDLARWQPPTTQSDSVAETKDGLVVIGLGLAQPFGDEYRSGEAVWQWMSLPFGQTVLAKRRISLSKVRAEQLPGERRMAHPRRELPKEGVSQAELAFTDVGPEQPISEQGPPPSEKGRFNMSMDQITDQVINSDFDPVVIGRAFNHVLERRGAIEDVVMFSSIIAKARIVRLRRRGR